MSSTLFALFIVFIFTFVFRFIVRPNTREIFTPWIFAVYVFAACAYRFVMNPKIVHLLLILIYYLSIAFLLNGFKIKTLGRNKAFLMFIPFVAYQFFAFRWGMDTKACFYQWLYVIMYSYAPGYCIASWAMERENGMVRLLKPVATAIALLGIVFIFFGAFSGGFAADERVALGSSYGGDGLNVNSIALIMDFVLMWVAAFLPMAFQTRMAHSGRLNIMMKSMFAVGSLIAIMVLLKTGSRNGALALVPVFYYMVFCFKGLSFAKKFAISTFFLVVMAGLVIASGASISSLRIFKYKETYTEDISNGRTAYHLRIIDSLRSDEKMLGIGSLVGNIYNEDRLPGMANGHSMYFQIFVQTGYIGSTLFVLAMLVFMLSLRGVRPVDGVNWKWLGYTFVLAWMLTGIGESVNYIADLPSAKTAFGFALALCSQRWVLRKRRMQMPVMPYGGMNPYGGLMA